MCPPPRVATGPDRPTHTGWAAKVIANGFTSRSKPLTMRDYPLLTFTKVISWAPRLAWGCSNVPSNKRPGADQRPLAEQAP